MKWTLMIITCLNLTVVLLCATEPHRIRLWLQSTFHNIDTLETLETLYALLSKSCALHRFNIEYSCGLCMWSFAVLRFVTIFFFIQRRERTISDCRLASTQFSLNFGYDYSATISRYKKKVHFVSSFMFSIIVHSCWFYRNVIILFTYGL